MNIFFDEPVPILFKLFNVDEIYHGTAYDNIIQTGFDQYISFDQVEICMVDFGQKQLNDYALF